MGYVFAFCGVSKFVETFFDAVLHKFYVFFFKIFFLQ